MHLKKLFVIFGTLFLLSGCARTTTKNEPQKENEIVQCSSLYELNEVKDVLTKVVINSGVGEIIVKEGETFSVVGENIIKDWVSSEYNNGEFLLNYSPEKPEDIKGIDTSSHKIIFTLPKEHNISFAEFVNGVGQV